MTGRGRSVQVTGYGRSVATLGAALAAALVVGCGLQPADAPVTSPGTTEPTARTGSDRTEGSERADATADAADDPEPDLEPVLHVVATVAPISDLVARVGGDRVEVGSLVPAGADSHTYEPRPQDVAVLSEADGYFGVGLDLNDGALELAEQHLPGGSPVVRLGEIGLGEGRLVHDHAHDHAHDGHSHGDDGHSHGDDGHSHGDDGHSHGDDGHSHGDDGHWHGDDGALGPNPHVWTSVRNAARLVPAIADELAALDPEGEDEYRRNAEELVAELTALDEDITVAARTVPEGHRTLVTYHDAWTYFARDYGYGFVTAVQPGDFSEPSAADVREVIDLLRELDVPAVFGSEVFPSRVLDAIAAETDAGYVGDLADDVLPGTPGDPDHSYVGMMRRNATTIVDALGGDASALGR
jgi:ABC-type Zn uptake system ZnuABC Zn-binding protein ZnuA